MKLKVMERTDDDKILNTFFDFEYNHNNILPKFGVLDIHGFLCEQTSRSKRTEDLECKQPRENFVR